MLIERLLTNTPIEAEEERPERERGFYISPSKAGMCKRAGYLDASGVEPEIPNAMMHIFEDGRVHEDTSIRWLGANGIEITDRQKPVNIPIPDSARLTHTIRSCGLCNTEIPPNHIHGHIDGIFQLNGAKWLFEHKAVGDDVFQRYKNEGVSYDYISQTALYLIGMRGITDALMLVKNRNSSRYLEAVLKYDKASDTVTLVSQKDSSGRETRFMKDYQGVFSENLRRFSDLESHISEDRLPPREAGTRCFSCFYKGACDAHFREDMANLRDSSVESLGFTADRREEFIRKVKEYYELKTKNDDTYRQLKSTRAELVELMSSLGVKKINTGDGYTAYCIPSQRSVIEYDEGLLREVLGNDIDHFIKNRSTEISERFWIRKEEERRPPPVSPQRER